MTLDKKKKKPGFLVIGRIQLRYSGLLVLFWHLLPEYC